MTTTRPGHEPTTRSPVNVDVAIDVNDLPRMKTFWEATLGYSQVRAGDSYSYLLDPTGRGPHLFLQLVPERRTEKNRLHLDVVVPSLKDAVESAESRGAVVLREVTTPITHFVVVEDPEGNQFCLVDEEYWEQTRPPYWEVRSAE